MRKQKTKNAQIDKITTVIGLGLPIVTLPQLYAVLTSDDISGVSVITWGYFTIQAAIFALFSIKHKEKPLVMTYIPLLVIQAGIVVTLIVRTI